MPSRRPCTCACWERRRRPRRSRSTPRAAEAAARRPARRPAHGGDALGQEGGDGLAGERGHVTPVDCDPHTAAARQPGASHDWWHEGDVDAIVRVEITPGKRFAHMIETRFGLAREGTRQRARDAGPAAAGAVRVRVLRRRRLAQAARCGSRVLFGAFAPIARRRGYRPTYPTMSRTTMAPAHFAKPGPPGLTPYP